MNKQNIILSLFAIVASALIVAPSVNADMCTTEYGGSTTCNPSDLVINKSVENPVTHQFVDNLTTTDPTFTPTSLVTYDLIITNNSGQTFDPVNVKDILPPYMTFVSGTDGTYDSPTNSVNWTLHNLIAGESRTIQVVLKVVSANQFPSGKSLFCVTNVGQVSSLNRNDSDSAQVCLQNGPVTTVTTLPVAGFDDFSLLLPFAGVALGGFALLKKRS